MKKYFKDFGAFEGLFSEWSGVDASVSSDDEGRGSVPVREYDQKGKPGTGTRMDYIKIYHFYFTKSKYQMKMMKKDEKSGDQKKIRNHETALRGLS